MEDLDRIRLEDLRTAVLNVLYNRRRGAHRVDDITHIYLPRGIKANRDEVETILIDLERFHRVQHIFEDDHDSIGAWQITGEGITHIERRGK